MASKGRVKPSLHTLSRETLPKSEVNVFWAEITGKNDRACAILCAAMVEQALVIALQTKMRPLTKVESDELFFEQNSPLRMFHSRTELSYAVRVIKKDEKRTIDILRRIRNVFAHALRPITFGHPLVIKECDKLPPIHFADTPETLAVSKHRRQCIEAALTITGHLATNSMKHKRYEVIRATVYQQYAEQS
jgi:hypothetical protein